MGSYVESDPKNFDGVWKSYMQASVLVDIRILMKKKMKMKKAGGDWFWISFQYERLPFFCFFYGIVGHSEQFCEKLYDNPVEKDQFVYGIWLRALNRRIAQNIGAKWLRTTVAKYVDGGSDDTNEGMAIDQGVLANPITANVVGDTQRGN